MENIACIVMKKNQIKIWLENWMEEATWETWA
jgi:hypothetical protein